MLASTHAGHPAGYPQGVVSPTVKKKRRKKEGRYLQVAFLFILWGGIIFWNV
jgi:hypothetical protein